MMSVNCCDGIFSYEKPDLVFSCRECGHLLFVSTKERTAIQIGEILEKAECPNCGEEPYENWIFVRFGNYDEEYEARQAVWEGKQ